MIRKHCHFIAAAATKRIQNAFRPFSTASSPPAPPVQQCPPLNKPTKVALQPKRPRPSTPLSALGKSRSSRFADAAAQRAARDPNEVQLEEMKKLKKEKKKGKKKKKRETPLFEGLTVKKPAHSDLPFAFRFSYTEVPTVKPIGFQAQFSPFGPGRIDRPWDGQEAPPVEPPARVETKRENRKKHVIDSFNPPSKRGIKPVTEPGPFLPGTGPIEAKTREEILGEPLTKEETDMLVKHSMKIKKQLNIGRDGLTHNMLICIFDYWTRERVVRVKCMGVSTVDMDNMVLQIEEKTGGKVIYRAGGTLHVFRGRNYNNKNRPKIPKMLWRPHSPVYPKLVTDKPGDLKLMEANALRKRGREILPLCRLAKNGFYGDLVQNVRDAFQEDDLVRIDCASVNRPDYKKIGAKLRDLVPCVLISFQNDQILIWKGRERRKRKKEPSPMIEAASKPPSDGSVVENVEASSKPPGDGDGAENLALDNATPADACETSGAESEEGQDDGCEGIQQALLECDDVDSADSREDPDSCATAETDSCVAEDDCDEDGPFTTDVDSENEALKTDGSCKDTDAHMAEDDSEEDDPFTTDVSSEDEALKIDGSCKDTDAPMAEHDSEEDDPFTTDDCSEDEALKTDGSCKDTDAPMAEGDSEEDDPFTTDLSSEDQASNEDNVDGEVVNR